MEEEIKVKSESYFKSRGIFIVCCIVIISLISGSLGGVIGVIYASRQPELAKLFNIAGVTKNLPGSRITITEDNSVIDVVKKAGPAVVSIVVSKDLSKFQSNNFSPFGNDFFFPFFGIPENRQSTPNIQQIGAGSGFFISSDGLILSNKHVVEDEQASYSVITNDNKTYEAKVLARDPINDLAILKIEISNAPVLELADTSALQVGQRVVAIGNSLGQYQNTVTTGIVSGIGRSITAGGNGSSENLEGVIQTDAAINPGNSGGPLLNSSGQVIGINTAIDREGQLVGFAIPAGDANRAVESYKRTGKITRPYLGVRYIMITKSLKDSRQLPRDHGALITRGQNQQELAVIPGSPADKAGLTENDIILEVNGKRIDETHSLISELKKYKIGDTLELTVFHKDSEKKVKLTLEEYKQ